MLELSLKEARRMNIGAQLLAGKPPKRPTKQTVRDTIRHLGALQIDSISVVARSHHIVLWSRLGNHPQEWLYELHGQDKALFEYWAHAAAYVPIEHYPLFRRMMLSYRDGSGGAWTRHTQRWIEEHKELVESVLDRVRTEGAVSTSSFAPPDGAKKAAPWAWYGNKPTNLALDLLWTNGTLMIDRREKFQRWYDLTERVNPSWDDRLIPVDRRRGPQHPRRARVDRDGRHDFRWLRDYFSARTRTTARCAGRRPTMSSTILADRLRDAGQDRGSRGGRLVQSALLDRKIPMSRTTLLSPFDSLVWDRRRAIELFDFPLMLEAYTPAPKRQYGYFSLPILYRGPSVGSTQKPNGRPACSL